MYTVELKADWIANTCSPRRPKLNPCAMFLCINKNDRGYKYLLLKMCVLVNGI